MSSHGPLRDVDDAATASARQLHAELEKPVCMLCLYRNGIGTMAEEAIHVKSYARLMQTPFENQMETQTAVSAWAVADSPGVSIACAGAPATVFLEDAA